MAAAVTLALALVLAGAGDCRAQAVSNPRLVEFVPSADHSATLAGGTPAVTRYDLQVYATGATAPFHTVDMGKPSPQADGFVRFDFSSSVASWPLPGGVYEVRVAAIGPNGTGRSEPSNQFTLSAPTCTYSVSPVSPSVATAGGSIQVTVTTTAGCAWTAMSNAGWITSSAASGSGNGTVTLAIAANAATSGRTGTVTIAGRAVTVTQAAAPCAFAVSPLTVSAVHTTGASTITVTTTAGCAWTAVSNATWITRSPSSGSGSGTVTLSIAANTMTLPRTGSLTIAGQVVTVNQGAQPCSYTVSPASASVSSAAGPTNIAVTTASGCSWTASSNVSWVTRSPSSGSGSGSVTLSVAANTTTSARTGTVTVAGKTITIDQAAAACTFSLTPTTASVAQAGGTSTLALATGSGCAWTAAPGATWLASSPSGGTGSASLTVTAAANPTTVARSATLSVAGRVAIITQAAAPCSFDVSPATASLASSATTTTVTVASTAGCSWTAASSASWMTSSVSSGTASGSVTLSVSANTAPAPRSGVATVAGKAIIVTQSAAACSFAVAPSSVTVPSSGGAVPVAVTTTSGCSWSASPSATWVALPSATGAGSGTLTVNVAVNPSPAPRTATVTVAGQQVTVSQVARPCPYSLTPADTSMTAAAGTVTLELRTLQGCNWSVATDRTWIGASPAYGSGTATVLARLAPNLSTSPRSGSVNVAGEVAVVSQAGASASDLDADDLPDAWESLVGLRPDSASGPEGAGGDPDADGLTNAQEFAGGTHPRGLASFTRYLAEGAAGPFFDTALALLNPGLVDAHVLLRFQNDAGEATTHQLVVPARSQRTVDPEQLTGFSAPAFSTIIESDTEVVVDRTMTWDDERYGGHSESAVRAPGNRWLFAEGATHSAFDLFLLLQNPSAASDAEVRVRYLLPAGPPLDKVYRVPAHSRVNIWVDYETWPDGSEPLGETDVSMEVEVVAGPPVIAERSMYRTSDGGPPFEAGHASAGVPAPALSWLLAEGATGPFFDEFVLVANPDPASTASVRMTYLLADGRVFGKTIEVPPASRKTFWVDRETFDGEAGWPLEDAALSTVAQSLNGVPIVVERSMWWPGPTPDAWVEAHNSPGATGAGLRWATAGGDVGETPANAETYILIANVSGEAGQARVTLLFEGGGEANAVVPTPAGSRTTIDVRSVFPQAVGRRFGVLVESLGASPAQLVVERAAYWDAGGRRWAAGTNSLATPLP